MAELNSSINEKRLKFAYFVEGKRKYLKKILIVFLIVFNVAAYPVLIYNYTLYFAKSKEIDQILADLNQRNIEFDVVNKSSAPEPLSIGLAGLVPLADGRYNLICEVQNPNRRWYASSIKLRFNSPSGFVSQELQSFVLPEEDKLLVDFNEKINGSVDRISCETIEVKWQRTKVDHYKFLTIPQDFTFDDVQFSSVPGSGATTQFKFINSTVYNLRDINLFVYLYEGNTIVGVERTTVDQIRSGEEKNIRLIWANASIINPRVVIKPEINIFDPTVFIDSTIIPSETR